MRRMVAEAPAPMSVSRYEFVVTSPRRIFPEPLCNRGFVKMNKNTLAELLDRREPVRVLRERRATHCELNILQVAVSAGRRGLEARETVET